MWENSMNTPSDLFIAKQPNTRPFQYPKKKSGEKGKARERNNSKKNTKEESEQVTRAADKMSLGQQFLMHWTLLFVL